MISIRQIIVVALVAAGLWLLKRLQAKLTEKSSRRQPGDVAATGGTGKTADDAYHDMVRCERCGAHVARQQATGNVRQGFFCVDKTCADSPKSGPV